MSSPRGAVLILGASSGIGRAVGHALARRGYDLVMGGRDADEAERTAADLRIRYAVRAWSLAFDLQAWDDHPAMIARAKARVGGSLRGAVVATGLLGDQGEAERSASHARTILDTNLAGVVSVLTALAPVLVQDGGGFVVVIGSVAGERGRRSNYTYGAAKAGLATWTQGFRARYRSEGIHVMTVKPGFVDTRMIYGRPGLIGVANPMVVGERIVRALERGALVVYVPRLWRWVMLGVRMVPERVAQRLAW